MANSVSGQDEPNPVLDIGLTPSRSINTHEKNLAGIELSVDLMLGQ